MKIIYKERKKKSPPLCMRLVNLFHLFRWLVKPLNLSRRFLNLSTFLGGCSSHSTFLGDWSKLSTFLGGWFSLSTFLGGWSNLIIFWWAWSNLSTFLGGYSTTFLGGINPFLLFRRLVTPFLLKVNDSQSDSWQVKGNQRIYWRVKERKFLIFYLLLKKLDLPYFFRKNPYL